MNNIRVLYIGDDPIIKDYLQKCNLELGWKTEALSPKIIAKEPLDPKPDLCFIDMDECSSGKLKSLFFELKDSIRIYLSSSKNEKDYLAYRKDFPFSYLIKPFSFLQLRAISELAIVSLSSAKKANHILQSWQEEKELHSSFYLKSHNKLLKVKQQDILAVVADGNYCVIITPQRRHAVKISLRRIKLKLSTIVFKQVHRNYIIQLPKIESIDLSSNEVFIEGEAYPIGGSYRQAFLDVLERI